MNLSSHLIDTYERKPVIPLPPPPRPPYPTHPSLATPAGNRTMDSETSWMAGHGESSSMFTGKMSGWSEEKLAALQVRLARKLGPEYVTQRQGPGNGPKLSYIEGWKVINLANEVFGFNGWNSSIVSLTTDFHDVNDQGRSFVNVTAIVRITLADGCWHEDVGCGQSENIKGKGAALDKAKKEAVTDATKRALRTFGNVLGNCLYDKDYTKEVVKIKVPPAKFQPAELERRPEFTPAGAPGPSKGFAGPTMMAPPAPPIVTSMGNAPERPSTPLQSVHDLPSDDYMDENFDPEFYDESFMNGIDATGNAMSTVQKPHPQPAPAIRPPPPGPPAYQHRQRPDNPPQAQNKPYDKAGAARRLAALQGEAPQQPADNTAIEESHIQSSGSSDTLTQEPAPRRPVGGFAYPSAHHTPNGASMRAQAISAAMGIPPRSESPKIPSGGVDAVVARAAHRVPARAAELDLQHEVGGENKVSFQSARGFKRNISGDISPTKPGGYQSGRTVLGELPDKQEEWAKRARGV